jgi:hypothetical protein
MVCPVDGFTVDRPTAAVLITFDVPIYHILEISSSLLPWRGKKLILWIKQFHIGSKIQVSRSCFDSKEIALGTSIIRFHDVLAQHRNAFT